MTISSPDKYVLLRDASATTRLTAQHYLWASSLGFSIHPEVPKLAPNAKVADVGTGAGLWLFDIAREIPASVQLDGFDIDLAQCPPKAWLPGNVNMHEWSVYEEPPSEFVGQYDYVHIRLIALVIKDNDAMPIIKNAAKLLKPGGYLQWDEVLNAECCVMKADQSQSFPALEELRKWMIEPKKGLGLDTWKTDLPQNLKTTGFQKATLHHYLDNWSKDRSLIKAYTNTLFALCQEFVEKVFKPGDEEAVAFRTRISRAMQEATQGAGIVFPQVICVAQKEI